MMLSQAKDKCLGLLVHMCCGPSTLRLKRCTRAEKKPHRLSGIWSELQTSSLSMVCWHNQEWGAKSPIHFLWPQSWTVCAEGKWHKQLKEGQEISGFQLHPNTERISLYFAALCMYRYHQGSQHSRATIVLRSPRKGHWSQGDISIIFFRNSPWINQKSSLSSSLSI